MNITKNRAILVLLLAFSLIAAACGDDAGGDDTTTTTEEPGDGATTTTAGASDGDVVEIRWYVGLGAGTDAPVIPLQEAIVEQFNETHDNIQLVLDVAPDPDQGATLMQTQVVAGNSPDIAGPVGVKGAAQFFGGWLDVGPYIEDYDLSDFDPALVEFWNQGGVQLGLPFAVFPQVLWYNQDLFDEAGLAYPPSEFGAPYVDSEGNERPWDLEALRELAMELTVDSNGLTPLDDGFDPDARVQWGWGNMSNSVRGNYALFGGANFVEDDNETCVFPDNWQQAANWYHDAIWTDYFHPDQATGDSEVLGAGNWFNTGNIGMISIHTWYAGWGTADLAAEFDVAAMPAIPGGDVTAKLHADTFAIPAGTDHPEEAVEVLLWMMSEEIAPQLAAIYGGIPARQSAQDTYISNPDNDFGFEWQVALDALSYPDIPSHEAWLPAYVESEDAIAGWWGDVANDPSADVDGSIGQLCGVLQPIYDRAEG